MVQRVKVVNRVTGAILVTSFVYAFVNSITSVLVNDVIDAFHLTGAAQGLMSSMLSLGLMLALLVNPLFQGRVGKVTMILVSGLLQVVALVLSGSAAGFVLYIVAIVILGVGCGWLDGYINSTMIDIHPTDSSKFLGLLHGLFGIGSLLAPLVMQWLLPGIGWRFVHVVIAALVFTAMALVAVSRKGGKEAGLLGKGEEERLSFRQLGGYLKKGRNMLLLGCAAMTSTLQTGITCWIVRYMLLAHGKEALGATCLTIYWIAATVNRFIAPRLRAKRLVLVMGGALLAAIFLVGGIVSGNAVIMCVCMGLLGLVTGHFMPMVVAECADGYHGNTTLTTSVSMFIMGIFRVLIPLLMAAVTDAVSVSVGMALPAVAGVLAAVFCGSALKVKKT